jgi:hypothetical protein
MPTREEAIAEKQRRAALQNAQPPQMPVAQPSILQSTGKPIISNPDNTISTEESITVNVPGLNQGKHTNIPTIINGKRVSPEEAIRIAIQNQMENPYPQFNSMQEAVAAAENRSNQLGTDYEQQLQEPAPEQQIIANKKVVVPKNNIELPPAVQDQLAAKAKKSALTPEQIKRIESARYNKKVHGTIMERPST